jgi:hypothetical protein
MKSRFLAIKEMMEWEGSGCGYEKATGRIFVVTEML